MRISISEGLEVRIDHTYHTARVGLNYHVGQGYEPRK